MMEPSLIEKSYMVGHKFADFNIIVYAVAQEFDQRS